MEKYFNAINENCSFFRSLRQQLWRTAPTSLSSLHMLPWLLRPQFKELYDAVEEIVSAMKKYLMFLKDCNAKMDDNHSKSKPVRDINDNWVLSNIDACPNVLKCYRAPDTFITNVDVYEPIDLINFEPKEKEARRKWIQGLSVSSSLTLFTYRYGNYLGNINIVWKIPDSVNDRDTMKEIDAANAARENIFKFATRQMQKNFIERYRNCPGIRPVKCYYSCIIACFSDVGLPSLFVTASSNISCFCQVECGEVR